MSAKRSITRRWLINNLGVITAILTVLVIVFATTIHTYYYSAARQYISSRLTVLVNTFTRYSQNANLNFDTEMRNMVETFSDKDKMELMVIDDRGNVMITSSGFSPKKNIVMKDYTEALLSPNNSGYYIGSDGNGGKIMAVCAVFSGINSDYSALRMVISLSNIDRQITVYVIIAIVISLIIISLVMISGLYFIKSIVIPVRQIGATAGRFAKGDFSSRIPKKSDDEIGELCDTVNYMADELSNAEALKNEFISSVSHELRTPLTAIKGWAETLCEVDDEETFKKGMRVISNESERLSEMVEELLDFSRMQNGKLALQKAKMDVLAELGEAVLIYEERAKKTGVKIIYNEPETLPIVFGDRNRIKQVFINVIDNAVKYSGEGKTVSIEAFEDEDGNAVVTISDNGCGISEKDLPRIKTKFYKANNTVKGSGIGLAVADEIIEMHGGTLDISSVLGEGTTVEITLPPCEI
ncbi:MAG: ATP-binding protein [Oscillospiraceae bacterium]